jgi:TRAP-type C4-dicarboxylate transport system permease small subunit
MWRRLLDRVPERYRPWLKVLAAAFAIFEAWRLFLVGTAALIPMWQTQLQPKIADIADAPLWITTVSFAVTGLAVAAQVTILVFGWRVIRRRFGRAHAAEGAMPSASVPRLSRCSFYPSFARRANPETGRSINRIG